MYIYICNIVKCSQKNSHTVKKHIHIHLYIRIFCRHSACWHCETSYIYLYNYIMIQWCHTSKETTNIISIYFIYIPIFIPSFIYYYFTCIYIYVHTHTHLYPYPIPIPWCTGADPPFCGMPPQQFFEVVGAQDAVALHAVVVRTAKAREETQAVDALDGDGEVPWSMRKPKRKTIRRHAQICIYRHVYNYIPSGKLT